MSNLLSPAPAVSSAPPTVVWYSFSLTPHSHPPSHPSFYHYPPHFYPPPVTPPYLPGPASCLSVVPSPIPQSLLPLTIPPHNYSSISAVFSEYQDLEEPCYYELPPPVDLFPAHSVSSLSFSGPSLSDPRLILCVMFLLGKKIIHACALIDPDSTRDFLNSFLHLFTLLLLPRGILLSPAPFLTGHLVWAG